ncbi:MAG: universal stress protein [Hyphomicrobiales bacterium]
MSYKTVLVNFQDAKRAPALIGFATTLAERHGAHLTGLFVMPVTDAFPFYAPMPVQVSTELWESQRQQFQDVADSIEGQFLSAADKAGVKAEWRCVDAQSPLLADMVVEHARSADLIVVGQPEPENQWESWAAVPEQVLMDSGRPVLVVPYAGEFDAAAKHVMVAWNGTRESARATFDAMPFLQAAGEVRILSVNLATGTGREGFTPGDDIAVTLARHDVKAEAGQTINGDISVGDELLSRAADYGTDLLVMGGYGHGKVYESLFGGATRHILRHMTMPVLMAH